MRITTFAGCYQWSSEPRRCDLRTGAIESEVGANLGNAETAQQLLNPYEISRRDDHWRFA